MTSSYSIVIISLLQSAGAVEWIYLIENKFLEGKPIKRKLLYGIPVLLWLGLIFILSSQPYQAQSLKPLLNQQFSQDKLQEVLPDVSFPYRESIISAKKDPVHFIEFVFRKGAHLFMYAMLAVLASIALLPYRMPLMAKGCFTLAAIGMTAILDEWNQLHRAERTGAVQDVFIDLSGGLIGLLLVSLVYLRLRASRRESALRGGRESGQP